MRLIKILKELCIIVDMNEDVITLDSLQIVNLIILLEEEFEISFNPEDFKISSFNTISSLINLINNKGGE
ncbi:MULTISPECIES: acyl carrier protein [Carnobacterium]|nr:acyl carrier protein [Carnobacterium maltaromaticum]